MAKYTIQLKDVASVATLKEWFSDYELSDYLLPSQVATIEESGLFDKPTLAQEIVDAYWVEEIGFETPALFKHQVKVKMREIMETALPKIYSVAIAYNPLHATNLTETLTRTTYSASLSSSSSSGTAVQLNSDTPENRVSKDDILAGQYASSSSGTENEASVSDSSNGSGSEEYTRTFVGNRGFSDNSQKLITEYRKTIIGVKYDIIKSLNVLFMGVY